MSSGKTGGSSERRVYPRRPVDLPGEFQTGRVGEGKPKSCYLLDYSYGGLHVEFVSGVPKGLSLGSTGMISFVSDTSGATTVHHVRIRVCRLQDRLAGCAFAAEPNKGTRKALEAEAQRREKERESGRLTRSALPADKVEEFVNTTWAAVRKPLDLLIRTMVPQLNAELTQATKGMLRDEERKAFLEAMGETSIHWEEVVSQWVGGLREDFMNLRHRKLHKARKGSGREASGASELSVVGDAEVEATVSIQSLVLEAERYHRDTLSLMNHGLSLATGSDVIDANSPLGPALITEHFHDAARRLYPHPMVQRVFLDCFKVAFLLELDMIYKRVDEVLREWGLYERARDAATDDRRSFIKKREPEEKESAKRAPRQAFANRGARARAPGAQFAGADDANTLEKQAGTLQDAELLSGPQAGGGGGSGSALDSSILVRLLTQLLPEKEGDAVPDDAPVLSDDELNNLLARLPQMVPAGGTDPLSFLQWLSEKAQEVPSAAGPVQFTPEQQASIGLVEKLFDTISRNAALPEQTIGWFRRLQVPILSLVLREPSFLSEADHPARQMLNQLARLGGDSEIAATGLDQTLDQYVERVVTEHLENPGIYEDVVAGLNRIVENRNQSFLNGVRRLQHTQDGRQRLINARRDVMKVLHRMMKGGVIRAAIMKLLDEGWGNLLVNTLVSEGEDSEKFRRYRRVLEALAHWLEGDKPRIVDPAYRAAQADNVDKVLSVIKAGLEDVTADPFIAGSHYDLFHALLRGPVSDMPMQQLQACRIDDLFDGEYETSPGVEDLGKLSLFQQGLVRRLRELRPGTVVLLSHPERGVSRRRLVWKAADLSRLVLSDDRGGSLDEMSLRDFFARAEENGIEFLDARSDSLVDTGLLEAIQDSLHELTHAGDRDELTGALTRREFVQVLEQHMREKHIEERESALLLVNVDWFDLLNNEVGHAAADQYLALLRSIISDEMPLGSVCGRLGTDEFGVLLRDADGEAASDIAMRLKETVSARGFDWLDKRLNISVSIGVVALGELGGSAEKAMQCASMACAEAKEGGRNRVVVSSGTDELTVQRQQIKSLATQVHDLVINKRLGLRLQPIVPLERDDAHHHHEALLLLRDEEGRIVSPQDFIIAAESYGQVKIVDRFMVETALRWMSDHPQYLETLGGIAINLSGHSVIDAEFLDFLMSTVRNAAVDPTRISFEITETSMVSNLRQATEFIYRVRETGCQFALDDFGAGMSSYAYLKNMPVDYLKIDGIFIREIVKVKEDLALVRSINDLAHFMGIRTIAEFVENAEILAQLKELGVDYAQGWEVGKPLPLEEFERACETKLRSQA